MLTFLLAFGIFLIVASWVHLIRYEAWWIRVFDFPHLQLVVPLAAVTIAYAVLANFAQIGDYVFMAAAAVTLGYHLYRIRPYTALHKHQVLEAAENATAGDSVRVLIFNVFMENRRCEEFLEMVGRIGADVVLVVETDAYWQEKLRPLEQAYPYRVSHPLDNTYGLLFYSQLPVVQHEINFFVEDDVPSLHAHLRLASGRVVEFYGVHPRPPAPAENDRSTERDVELIQVGKRAKAAAHPVIVAGDLNDVAWSHTTRLFQRISGLLDPRIGRGMFNTFHAKHWLLRWPLDHVFVSHHFKLIDMKRLPNCGSDHFPIYVHLRYAPDPESKENRLEAEAEDHAEAREKEMKVHE
ncbi:MAG: endonuclease/exonuclease/phosphatase family protein [Cytophagales bacterium]|nr:endonuclease/exonuclease/phosphatase family protein [Cytophagales bacterium]